MKFESVVDGHDVNNTSETEFCHILYFINVINFRQNWKYHYLTSKW